MDDTGRVVGVAVATFTGGQNLNFAVPAQYLTTLQRKKRELRPLSRVSSASASTSPSTRRNTSPRLSEGVVGENLTFDSLGQSGEFSYSLRNKLPQDIRNVLGYVVFYDTNGNPIDTFPIRHSGTIPAGLAKRVRGVVSESVEKLNSAGLPDFPYLPQPPRRPVGRVAIRILDFEFNKAH